MKTKLLLTIALLSTLQIFAQFDGWNLYTRASTISKIVPDYTNTDELHLATDIGYIKYNTTSEMVTDYLNLTTQNPAIGNVNGLSLNPTNNNIALALNDGIAIYNGTTVTIYNYDNSALTAGSAGNQFTKLEVRYGSQGELYIFRPNVTGYQLFNAGVFDVEVVTTFKPQDIVENNTGAKVYFAGSNNGLWELVKSTSTLTNFTSSNSVLITNTLKSLHVDVNDVLYIGGFQGLNTMTPAGIWSTYQQSAPPPSAAFFLPVYNISVNETTGDLLIRTSEPNTSFFGLSTVDLTTNTWTNYTNDNTNCLNANVFTATTLGTNGEIYVAPQDFSSPEQFIVKFDPGANTCTPLNINYLNAPTAVNSGQISSFTVRKKASGNLDIGFTRGENLHILEINPVTFIGSFPTATTIVPSAGKSVFSVIADNDFFIVETNTGWVFVDGANNTTEFSHGLPNHLAIITKKAAAFDSSNGIINLIFKGFDAAFNYRVYKTQCNTATGTCSAPEEIFTTNRDFTKNIVFGVDQNDTTGQVTAVAVKVGASSGRIGGVNSDKQGTNADVIFLTELKWDSPTNGSVIVTNEDIANILFPSLDPIIFERESNILVTSIVKSDSKTFHIRTKSDTTGENISNDFSFDKDNDGVPDEILGSSLFSLGIFNLATFIIKNSNGVSMCRYVVGVDASGEMVTLFAIRIDPTKLTNTPSDFLVINSKLTIEEPPGNSRTQKAQNQNDAATMVMLTNYGMLIKTGIDISNLILSTEDVSLKDANLLLYPNPANDIVSFSDNSIKTITVYDINGRKVLSTTNSNSFSVKTLAQGIYIIKGTSDNNVVVTKKLIVE